MEFEFAAPSPATTIHLDDQGLSVGDPIDPFLSEYWRDGQAVVIPEGRYRLQDPAALELSATEDTWLVGEGTVVLEHGRVSEAQFNFEAREHAHLRVQNLTLRGSAVGTSSKMRAWAPSQGLVELVNVNRPDGTEDVEDAIGCYVPPSHAGMVRFIDCHMEGFSNNGVYASSPGYDRGNDGTVEFYGGLYRNCDVAGIRVGSSQATVVGAVVVNDETAPTNEEKPHGVQRGIRIRAPGEGIRIEECDIYHGDAPGVARPIAVENGLPEFPAAAGSAIIVRTRIHNDTTNPPVTMRAPDAGYEITGEELHLTGRGNMVPDGGPYMDVRTDGDADSPRTEKRWVYVGPYAVDGPTE